MGGLPTGTVTFLFTDIEGSTRLLHEFGAAYAELLQEHRLVLRDAFTRHGGVEVDLQGDAFFVAFARAGQAIAAARDAQTAFDGPIRVRIGIHTGEPLLVYHVVSLRRGHPLTGGDGAGAVSLQRACRFYSFE